VTNLYRLPALNIGTHKWTHGDENFTALIKWWCGYSACQDRQLKWPCSGVLLYKMYRFASWCILICSIYTYESIIKIIMPILMAIKKELLGDNPLYFLLSVYFVSLSLGSCYLCNNLSLSFLFCFCAKNSL
jgi:hypothetical protein